MASPGVGRIGEPCSVLPTPTCGDTYGLDLKNLQSAGELYKNLLGQGHWEIVPAVLMLHCVWEYERVGKESIRTRKMEGFSDFPLSES